MITCMECSGVVGYKELPNCIQYFYMLSECFTARILGCTLKRDIFNARKYAWTSYIIFLFKKGKNGGLYCTKLKRPALQWHQMVADQNTTQRQDICSD